MRDYLTPPSPAPLVLLQAVANRDAEDAEQAQRFWGRRTEQDLTVEVVHCDHWEILESDEVRGVATLITTEVERLDRLPSESTTAGQRT
jgi:thioesterase domain-containing protein